MKNESREELLYFLLEGFIWAVVTMVWYRGILFRCLPGMTYAESKILLWGIVILVILMGVFITYYGSQKCSIMKELFLAYGSYTVLAYQETFATKIKIMFAVSMILAFLYAVLVLIRKIRSRRRCNRKKNIVRRLCKCLYAYFSITSISMAVLMCIIIGSLRIGNSFWGTSVKAVNKGTIQEQTIENNIEILLLLQEDKWEKLSVERKKMVMETVASIEAHYLGLPHELNVVINNPQESVLGSYSDNTHTIYIALKHIEEDAAAEILETVLHESFHCYTHRLIEAYFNADKDLKNLRIYKRAALYLQEFGNYTEGNQDFDKYYNQLCEVDARNYASEAVEDYYMKINSYLNGMKQKEYIGE